jgi:hypothetical protein
MICNKSNGLLVSSNFDAGRYMGSFTIVHDKMKLIQYNDDKMTALALSIAVLVENIFDENEDGE